MNILQRVRILDLLDLDEEQYGFEVLKSLASSALLLAPNTGDGWVKKQYIFSRFVGDCAREAGFDAIQYGSVKNVDGKNIVFLTPPLQFSDFAEICSNEKLVCEEATTRF
tara:strand:+ start:5005 stop:5334 length:330 start_codon:yes stop_codon:yes gene_type:complete